jgi:Ca-activated chloride channel homolog
MVDAVVLSCLNKIVRVILLVTILFFSNFNLSAQTADDDEVITVNSALVVLNATITDAKGKPVLGLKKSQFQLYDDGKLQDIYLFENEKASFAAIILVDTSGSMESRVSIARASAISFLNGLREDDQVAIYNFDSKIELVQEFSNSRDIADKVFNLKANGWTVLNDAIYKAAQELKPRPEKRKAIIVISDGADTKSGRSAEKALKEALEANALIYAVDMSDTSGNGAARIQNQNVLKNFAEKSGGKFIPTPGGAAMREAFENIVEELGNQYTLGYSPTGIKDGKWRSLELKVMLPNLTIRTRKGYTPANENKK